MEITLFLQTQSHNLHEQESRSLKTSNAAQGPHSCAETPLCLSWPCPPEAHSAGFTWTWFSGLTAVIWEPLDYNPYSSKHLCWLIPRVTCPNPTYKCSHGMKAILQVAYIYDDSYGRQKFPSSLVRERYTVQATWLAPLPVFPHVCSNWTSYFCILLVLAKIVQKLAIWSNQVHYDCMIHLQRQGGWGWQKDY